jgi:hypothetical protein
MHFFTETYTILSFFTPTTEWEEKRKEKKRKKEKEKNGFPRSHTYIASVDALIRVSQEDELVALKVKSVGGNVADIFEGTNQLVSLFSADLITMNRYQLV